jgi:hypothetical protein
LGDWRYPSASPEATFASSHGGVYDSYRTQMAYGDGSISFREGNTIYFSNGTQAPVPTR